MWHPRLHAKTTRTEKPKPKSLKFKLLNHPAAMSLLRPLPDGVCRDGKTDPFSYARELLWGFRKMHQATAKRPKEHARSCQYLLTFPV